VILNCITKEESFVLKLKLANGSSLSCWLNIDIIRNKVYIELHKL